MSDDVFNPEGFEPQQENQQKVPFDLPYDRVPLPSRGELYPEDHPLYKKTHVDFKSMGAYEEDILSSDALIKSGKVLNVLMKSCLVDKTINPNDILIGDKNAILVGIRISGFGPDYVLPVKCNSCRETSKYAFNLSELAIQGPGDTEHASYLGGNLFECKTKESGATVKFKLLTQSEQNDIDKAQENRRKALAKRGKVDFVDTSNSERLIKSIVSVNGNEDKAFIRKFVMNTRIKEKRFLNKIISEVSPKIVMEQDFTCPACGAGEVRRVPIHISFFWPEDDF